MVLAALVFAVVAQAGAPADTAALEAEADRNIAADKDGVPLQKPPTRARVHLETTARSAKLLDRATGKVVCEAPCDADLPTGSDVHYQLFGGGDVLSSEVFHLEGAIGTTTIRWRAATGAARAFGVALIILGGLAVMSAIGVGFASLYIGLSCSFNGFGCPRFDWAWSALPLSLGGYVALGFGMALTFRFGIEKITLEAGPAAP